MSTLMMPVARKSGVEQARDTMVMFETALGWMAVAGRDEVLSRLWFGYGSRDELDEQLARDESLRTCAKREGFAQARDLLTRYASGERVDLRELKISLGDRTAFQVRVLEATWNIPYGQTRTYGELAREIGHPGAARAVGSVMASNRLPLVVPCHRVLGAAGKLTGFSAPGELATKRYLLEMEQGGGLVP